MDGIARSQPIRLPTLKTYYWLSVTLVLCIAICRLATSETTQQNKQISDGLSTTKSATVNSNEKQEIVSEVTTDEALVQTSATEQRNTPGELSSERPTTETKHTPKSQSPSTREPTTALLGTATTDDPTSPVSTVEKSSTPNELSSKEPTKDSTSTQHLKSTSPSTKEPLTTPLTIATTDESKFRVSTTETDSTSNRGATTKSRNTQRLKSQKTWTKGPISTPPGNITYPHPLSPVPIANVTVKNITHKSATVFWEQLDQENELSYRLVGYKLTPLTMDVKSKITDLFVNASKQRRHRLIQESLYHNTRYMFCVIPVTVEDAENESTILPDVTNGLSVLNTTDCFSFKTLYNPLNPKAVIAFGFALFILAVFICTAVSSQLYHKSQEEEEVRYLVLDNC